MLLLAHNGDKTSREVTDAPPGRLSGPAVTFLGTNGRVSPNDVNGIRSALEKYPTWIRDDAYIRAAESLAPHELSTYEGYGVLGSVSAQETVVKHPGGGRIFHNISTTAGSCGSALLNEDGLLCGTYVLIIYSILIHC